MQPSLHDQNAGDPDKPQNQPLGKKQINPKLPKWMHRIERGTGRIICIVIIILGTLWTLFIFMVMIFAPDSKNATSFTSATITKVMQDINYKPDGIYISNDGTTPARCTIHYKYTVDGRTFTQEETQYDENCSLAAGESIQIRYDPNNPASSYFANTNYVGGSASVMLVGLLGLPGIFMLLIGSFGLFAISRSYRSGDFDNDGVPGDLLPATKEQMKLIENGMRELGQFYTPKKRLNQMEARQILERISKQMEENKRRV